MALGWQPIIDDIFLADGQDWILERRNAAGAIATNTEIWVEWANGTRWDATIIGDIVRWKVESAQADLIPHGTAFVIRVRYPESDSAETADFNWYEGRAWRRRT